jgi:hypothetical protein
VLRAQISLLLVYVATCEFLAVTHREEVLDIRYLFIGRYEITPEISGGE